MTIIAEVKKIMDSVTPKWGAPFSGPRTGPGVWPRRDREEADRAAAEAIDRMIADSEARQADSKARITESVAELEAEFVTPSLRADLQAARAAVANLEAELAARKAELETLKANPPAEVGEVEAWAARVTILELSAPQLTRLLNGGRERYNLALTACREAMKPGAEARKQAAYAELSETRDRAKKLVEAAEKELGLSQALQGRVNNWTGE